MGWARCAKVVVPTLMCALAKCVCLPLPKPGQSQQQYLWQQCVFGESAARTTEHCFEKPHVHSGNVQQWNGIGESTREHKLCGKLCGTMHERAMHQIPVEDWTWIVVLYYVQHSY